MTLPVTEKPKTLSIGQFLAAKKSQLQLALPKHIDADRLLRICLTEMRKNPKLQDCSQESFFSSIMQAGQLGIEPGGSLGHGYLIPYKTECQFMLGYRGMIDLARRSGEIVSISAHAVYENDLFEFEYGINERLKHIPTEGNTGRFVRAYAIAKLKDGGYQFEVMNKEKIDAIRARSKTKDFGPWVTDYDEMAIKTVIRKLFKYLPISIELRDAITNEDEKAFDGDFSVVNTETGEITKTQALDNKIAQAKVVEITQNTNVKNPVNNNDEWKKEYDNAGVEGKV